MRLALVPRQRFEQPAKRHGHTLVRASLVVLGKAGKQVVHLADRALQRRDHIGPELGLVGMTFGVARNPAQLADQILDVVQDRKRVVEGKNVSVRVDLGGSRLFNKKKNTEYETD